MGLALRSWYAFCIAVIPGALSSFSLRITFFVSSSSTASFVGSGVICSFSSILALVGGLVSLKFFLDSAHNLVPLGVFLLHSFSSRCGMLFVFSLVVAVFFEHG